MSNYLVIAKCINIDTKTLNQSFDSFLHQTNVSQNWTYKYDEFQWKVVSLI